MKFSKLITVIKREVKKELYSKINKELVAKLDCIIHNIITEQKSIGKICQCNDIKLIVKQDKINQSSLNICPNNLLTELLFRHRKINITIPINIDYETSKITVQY